MPAWGISANVLGLYPWGGLKVACSFGGRLGQPDVTVPLQVLVLISDSVLSPWFIANSVCSAASISANEVPAPVGTAGGVPPHPDVIFALQVAPLMTETVPLEWPS